MMIFYESRSMTRPTLLPVIHWHDIIFAAAVIKRLTDAQKSPSARQPASFSAACFIRRQKQIQDSNTAEYQALSLLYFDLHCKSYIHYITDISQNRTIYITSLVSTCKIE